MKAHPRVLTGLLVLTAAALAAVAATAATAAGPSINAAPQAGTVWERGLQNAAGHARHTSNPNLTWHGGSVMHGTTAVYPIFWGTSWPSYSGDEITGIKQFYGAVGGSSYADTNTEYTDGSGHVSSAVSTATPKIDGTAAISHAPQTSDILAEVGRVYGGQLVRDAYYPVYVDQARGSAQYCAWHSSGTINGVRVQFAFFFKLDGDPGCNPGATGTGHSQGLDALANVSGHELSEMLTDPQLNAWYDSQGAENADKCAWTFGSSLLKLGDNSQWKIQGNWSNSAYTAGRGYTFGGKTVVGCVDGTN